MTPNEKIAYVAEGIRNVRSGEAKTLHCPYCDGINSPIVELCCDKMKHCVEAVLNHEDVMSGKEMADRIAEACVRN